LRGVVIFTGGASVLRSVRRKKVAGKIFKEKEKKKPEKTHSFFLRIRRSHFRGEKKKIRKHFSDLKRKKNDPA